MNVPADRTTNGSGFSEVSWPILGGGFAVGLLCGAVWLMSARGTGSAETVDAAPPAADALDVHIENERLRHELEVARLQARIVELERQLALSRTAAAAESASVAPPVTAATTPPTPVPSSRPAPVPGSAAAHPRPSDRAPQQSAGRATLDYWNRMNRIIANEATMRTAPAGGVTASNAGSFLDRRIAAGEYATKELQKLDTTGVDPEVVALARDVAAWYREGVAVCRTGKQLLSGYSTGSDIRAATEKYRAAEQAHAAAVNSVNARGAQVREVMSRRYSLTFPPLN